ncbi:MAG TPA: J domain-containing protein [Terracidiphilus sp.]|jgi:hypothetical protein|nr:J domain-containing protein [Terracidiphilus sp.]
MPCSCRQCEEHAKTLGLARRWLSRAALRKAFRTEAKRWHPDRFENEPVKRADAEERFKLVQVAYRELWEHLESPVATEPEPVPQEVEVRVKTPKSPEPPPIFFVGAPGCYTWPHFPRAVAEIIAGHLQETERALAFIDLSYRGAGQKGPAQYLLLTSYRLFFRNHLFIVSLLWYTDLGEIRLVDQFEGGKQGMWQRIVETFSGIQQRYALEIDRHTGALFCTLTGELDDSVKKVVYNFLRQAKNQSGI